MFSRCAFVAVALVCVLSISFVECRPPTLLERDAMDLVGSFKDVTADNIISTGEYAKRQHREIPTKADPNGPLVKTELGMVQGYTQSGVNVWRGSGTTTRRTSGTSRP